MNTTLIEDLECRGLIAQATDINAIKALLCTPQVVYCGFDPTAGSLHIGHLVPLILLKRFQDAGHRIIVLLGGATGLIGDPSFKAIERSLNSTTTVSNWVNELATQILDLMLPKLREPLTLVNNADWLNEVNVITFFRDVGKHFSINNMLNRESVRQRLQRPDQGISFTEFSYSLLQSYDFAELNRRFGCCLQVGGNDQWGNILGGIDFTRRRNGSDVFGLTLPIITKSDGTKFGKSETGTVWLDAGKTSPYAFYQFWLNAPDADVYRFLHYYTFISCDEIARLQAHDKSSQSKPQAQHVLAEELTRFVHGEAGLASAQRISKALFHGEVNELQLNEIMQLQLDGLPTKQIAGLNLVDAVVQSGLAISKRAARELIAEGAISVNGKRASTAQCQLGLPLYEKYWLLQRGRKQFVLLAA